MLNRFLAQRRRRKCLDSAPPGALRDYLLTPLPLEMTPIAQAEYMALDFETTGLDLTEDEILSFGFVQISQLSIDLRTAVHRLVRPAQNIPEQSAIIHQILDDTSLEGMPLKTVLDEFLHLLRGKILLAHYAVAESSHLSKACESVYGCGIVIPVIDTLLIERRRHGQSNRGRKQLKLHESCRRYNLPQYRLHDALNDAISCAELFIAQAAHLKHPKSAKIGQWLQYLP